MKTFVVFELITEFHINFNKIFASQVTYLHPHFICFFDFLTSVVNLL